MQRPLSAVQKVKQPHLNITLGLDWFFKLKNKKGDFEYLRDLSKLERFEVRDLKRERRSGDIKGMKMEKKQG